MKIRIHPVFYLYLLFVGLIDGFAASVGLLFTLMIHEIGHLFAGKLCGETYEKMLITPLGGMISYKSGSASCKGIRGAAIAAAGPAANLASAYLLIHSPMLLSLFPQDIASKIVMMNLAMALINLVPVLPLDGGRIVFSVGYYLFRISALTAVLSAFGRVWGSVCIILALFSAAKWGKMNITLLIAGFFIFCCTNQQRESVYHGSLHAVIQERLAQYMEAIPCQVFSVQSDTNIGSIIPYLCRTKHMLIVIERENGPRLIEERRLLKALMTAPAMTFDQAFPEILENTEKNA